MAAQNLLLLPGMMCDARQWGPQVAGIDLPTFHADTIKTDNFSDMAASVLATAPDHFAVAGLSMGGILAFELWRQAPGRITHMVLLDTNPHAEAADRQALRWEQIEQAASGKLRELAIESLKPMYLAKAHRDDERLLELILSMALDLGPDVFRTQSLALQNRVDSVATLASIDCPALIMCGAEDTLCPVAYHELMASEIPQARLQVIENCGHLSSLEQPQIVTTALNELLAQ